MKYLRLEIYKMKRRKVLLTFLLILGVELLFVFSNYGKNANFISMIAGSTGMAGSDHRAGSHEWAVFPHPDSGDRQPDL